MADDDDQLLNELDDDEYTGKDEDQGYVPPPKPNYFDFVEDERDSGEGFTVDEFPQRPTSPLTQEEIEGEGSDEYSRDRRGSSFDDPYDSPVYSNQMIEIIDEVDRNKALSLGEVGYVDPNKRDSRKSSDGMGGMLNYYDPILFKVDEILGPDPEDGYLHWQGSDMGIHHVLGEDEFPDFESGMRADGRRQESDPALRKPVRVDSEKEFQELYMRQLPSDEDVQRRLSLEALNLESRVASPSPPETPKKTFPRMHECPSVESFLRLGDPVRIQFVVLPGQKIFSMNARVDRTILQIKKEISPICKVPPQFLDLRKNRNLVMDYKTLRELGAKPRKKLKFTVEVSKRCPPEYTLRIPEDSSVISQIPPVTRKLVVATSRGWKPVQLTIEFAAEAKMFLGGYRDRRCNVFHHAVTQTPFYSEPYSDTVRHFSCQTFDNTWKVMQTRKDQYQQTARPDYYLSEMADKVIWARPYLNSDYIERKRIKAAIIIQKYWRRWLAIRERKERMDGLIRRIEWAENIRKGRTESRLMIKEDELWRQHHPSRMVDVELLYRAINEWRRKQVAFVEAHRWGADRKAALAEIMEKEADLLLDLERTKTMIQKNLQGRYIEKAFHKMGAPTRWLNRSGNFVSMDNQSKFTVRQYQKLYHALKAPVTDVEDRYQLLDKLFQYVKVFNSMLSQYLVNLIGREITLMKGSAGNRLLIGLRQRITNTFYHLLRDPLFNPEARKLQKVPFDSMKLRKDMIQCKGCRQMQYRDQFTVVRGVTVTTRCVTCTGLYRTCILRADLNLYRRMLSELRHDEQTAGVYNSVTYLIDAYDLQFLIEQLWHGQSALSGIDDRYLLRLCRWKHNLPWTPWNCVLLTEEESVAHLHLENMKDAYQASFFHKVHVKHQSARIYFARLTTLALPLDPALEEMCNAAAAKKKKAGAKKKAKKAIKFA